MAQYDREVETEGKSPIFLNCWFRLEEEPVTCSRLATANVLQNPNISILSCRGKS